MICLIATLLGSVSCIVKIGDPLIQPVTDGTGSNFTEFNYTQLIDHFPPEPLPDADTYQQRYWVNDDYYDAAAGGPVVVYICGEWTCSGGSVEAPYNVFGIKHKAKLISLEHRFYGTSQPFNASSGGWSTENLKYLNTSQALADTAQFINYINSTLTVKTDNFMIVGGSYPGAMVAWFKHVYPDQVKAVWSSSGVINAIQDYLHYDMDVYLTTSRCLNDTQTKIAMLSQDVERILLGLDTRWNRTDFLSKFGATDGGINNGEFMYLVGDWAAGYIQGGASAALC